MMTELTPVTISFNNDPNIDGNDLWYVYGRLETTERSDIGARKYLLQMYIPTDLIASPVFADSLRTVLDDMVVCAHKDACHFLESGYEDRNEWIYDNYHERHDR